MKVEVEDKQEFDFSTKTRNKLLVRLLRRELKIPSDDG